MDCGPHPGDDRADRLRAMVAKRKPRPTQSRPRATARCGMFHEPSMPPATADLAAALGAAHPHWRRFTDDVHLSCGPLVDEWSFSRAFGWTLRLKQPARVLVYLTPCASHFLASFVLGEGAYKAIRRSGGPAAIMALIDAAPKYAEGRGVRIPVRTKADLECVLKIAGIKASNAK